MTIPLRNCSFVNFTNISNAIKAIDGVKNKPEYANLRIAHGKDRCANPPRSGPQGSSGVRRSASGNGPNSAEPVSAIGGDNGEQENAESAFLSVGGDGVIGDVKVEDTGMTAPAVYVSDAQAMHVDVVEPVGAAAPAIKLE